jgi:prepilin peptidase CpaA
MSNQFAFSFLLFIKMNALPTFIAVIGLAPLAILLFKASLEDINNRRIPNKLVLVGVLLGLTLNVLLPEGLGFNSLTPGGLGGLKSFQGLGLGLLMLMPMYLLQVMGAGDVKLMAMVGSFVGPSDLVGVFCATLLIGGLIACVVALRSKSFKKLIQNLKFILIGSMVKICDGKLPLKVELPISVGHLPYAVSISMGTVSFMIWQRLFA